MILKTCVDALPGNRTSMLRICGTSEAATVSGSSAITLKNFLAPELASYESQQEFTIRRKAQYHSFHMFRPSVRTICGHR